MKSTRISLVSSDTSLASHIQLRLQSKGYQTSCLSCLDSVLGAFYSDPPDLLIVDFSTHPECSDKIVSTLRNDSFFSAIPILGLLNDMGDDSYPWEQSKLDDFVCLPLNFGELFSRISLSLSRIKRIFDNNPLTRLPGNTSIHRAIEESMGTSQAICYVDINHFKPYNDVYGFSHGDEVIRMTARIMFNAVREGGGGFCGHIGGDDFVFIVDEERAGAICHTTIDHFDQIVLDLFDQKVQENGYYMGNNRRGDAEQIPILSLSIAVVSMSSPKIQHSAKVAELAAEMKKLAKQSPKSCVVKDQRRI